MTCVRIPNGIVCFNPGYRLRLDDGRHVFMEWHSYCGPTFFKDKNLERVIDDWWDDEPICKALDWFIDRGKVA